LVAPVSSRRGEKPDESFFSKALEGTPFLAERFASARRIAPVRALSDWSYSSERVAGDRWLMVGDAAGFIDPVFSTGVYLGMTGAFRAAPAIEQAFARRRFGRSEFVDYERFVQRSIGIYREFVRDFYHPAFVEVLLRPSDWMGLRGAVTSLLAGYGMEHPEVRRRVALFRLLARLNRHVPLVPRLEYRRRAQSSLESGA
jgi:flavin-dependent dehydrogenase